MHGADRQRGGSSYPTRPLTGEQRLERDGEETRWTKLLLRGGSWIPANEYDAWAYNKEAAVKLVSSQ